MIDSCDVADALVAVGKSDVCLECGLDKGTALHRPASECGGPTCVRGDHHEYQSIAEGIALFLITRIQIRESHGGER